MRNLLSTAVLLAALSLARAADPLGLPPPELIAEPPAASVIVAEEAGPPPPPRLAVGVEYLLWWIKDGPVPGSLLTTSPPTTWPPGVLGIPGTEVVRGDEGFDYRYHSGVRLFGGCWLDECRSFGVEASGFLLESHTVHVEANSDKAGAPLLARPYIDALTDQPAAYVITAPGWARGGIDIFSDSRLWGAELNLVGRLYESERLRLDLVGGFRYLGLKDELRFSQSSTLLGYGVSGFIGSPIFAPNIVSVRDLFETQNHYFGGQGGLRATLHLGRWSLENVLKVGGGVTYQNVKISGHTTVTDSSGFTALAPGGLYAQVSNLTGWTTRYQAGFVLEDTLRLRCRLTDHLSAHVGYNFLYWSNVARPGDQIDLRIDPRQIPSGWQFQFPSGATHPEREPHATSFWAQGLLAGLELRF